MFVSTVLRKEQGTLENTCEEVSRVRAGKLQLASQILPWPNLGYPES